MTCHPHRQRRERKFAAMTQALRDLQTDRDYLELKKRKAQVSWNEFEVVNLVSASNLEAYHCFFTKTGR